MDQNANTGSVSQWLADLNNGGAEKSQAQGELWNRYFARLASFARSRMPKNTRRAVDEEDVALSALDSFFRRTERGEFPHLSDRTGLWPLLARITRYKAIQRVQHERAAKRGGDKVIHESDLQTDCDTELPSLDEVTSGEPTADFKCQMDEQVEALMAELDDDMLRQIAQMKLEGYENTEIADEIGKGLRTVERKLFRIRTLWKESVT
ncbi:MAG: RNA polymerase subunit sigma-70 [Planctomycetaceae bacterium]|nr:RNA polymerase subunit sigma-70 [Planctomycetaceae bacterium]